MTITRTLLGALLSLILLAQPALAAPRPAQAFVATLEAPVRQQAQEKEDERSCRSGKSTRQFGWKVVAFGVSTLKYLIGLLIIPIGLFLVCIGAVLEAVEWVAC
jgi:hypothetical protein